jgi:hypothetical protein
MSKPRMSKRAAAQIRAANAEQRVSDAEQNKIDQEAHAAEMARRARITAVVAEMPPGKLWFMGGPKYNNLHLTDEGLDFCTQLRVGGAGATCKEMAIIIGCDQRAAKAFMWMSLMLECGWGFDGPGSPSPWADDDDDEPDEPERDPLDRLFHEKTTHLTQGEK